MNSLSVDDLFEQRRSYPDPDAQERLAGLVGVDDLKEQLAKVLAVLVNPAGLTKWMEHYHPDAKELTDVLLRRPPLIVLAGEVGCGKTELAESIGDLVARQENISITLFPLSLATRGRGRVGEMTQLLSAAFDCALEEARRLKSTVGKSRGAVILLVDEADAIAQSRDATEMHHEDRAGVNAFIRGIDRLGNGKYPAAIIMCTNRLDALDPAVQRRAADVLRFERPTSKQRLDVIGPALQHLGISEQMITSIVDATGDGHGFTFSDLRQRLLPAIVLDAYPEGPVSQDRALEIAREMSPTPPLKEEQR